MFTPASQVYLDMMLYIQMLEPNLEDQLNDIRTAKRGHISFVTTEGRYRVLIPDLLTRFHISYPDVILDLQYGTTQKVSKNALNNNLDVALLNQNVKLHRQLEIRTVAKKQMYLVILGNLSERYFPNQSPVQAEI